MNDLARIAQATNSDQYTSVTQDMALRKQGTGMFGYYHEISCRVE